MSRTSILLSLWSAMVWSCTHKGASGAPDTPSSEQTSPVQSATPEGDPGDGLQCAVQAILQTHCVGCHAPDAKNGVPLVTLDDLRAASATHPGETIAARALVRMRDADRPMPPRGAPVEEAEIDEVAQWIATDLAESLCP